MLLIILLILFQAVLKCIKECWVEYTKRPKMGNERKSWDKLVAERNEQPMSVAYSPNNDYQFKGWVCQWNTDPLIKHIGYGSSSCHTFYFSNDL